MSLLTSQESSQARWRILRAALLGEEIQEKDVQASIHRFQGFSLLSKRIVSVEDDQRDNLVVVDTLDDVLVQWMMLQCLSTKTSQIQMKVTAPFSCDNLKILRTQLASLGILCSAATRNCIDLEWRPRNDYICQEWKLPLSEHVLWIRERTTATKKHSLHSLVSQQHYNGVDNTGNARVWDAEIVLVHAIMTSPIVKKACGVQSNWNELAKKDDNALLHVLELGAGMAGMAGLALAMKAHTPIHVTITDGHPNCILQNLVHVRLNTFPDTASIEVKQLVWTTTLPYTSNIDLLLCSDCTHFQEHHVALVVTMACLLRVGGVAILCQPPRGNSLQNFLAHVKSMEGLWSCQYFTDYDDEVTRRHVQELETKNPCYQPDIHYPHVVVLTKNRAVTDADRRLAQQNE